MEDNFLVEDLGCGSTVSFTTMLIVSWNCRGLARPMAGRAIRAMVRVHKPECIFLSETKVSVDKMCLAMSRLGYQNCLAVASVKKSGGLCLAWQNGVDIRISFSDKNCINGPVFSDPPLMPWMSSAVYGPLHKAEKASFWRKLQLIVESVDGPWLCCGDFNSVTCQEEKGRG